MLDSKLYEDIWTPEMKEEARNLAGPIIIIGASGFIGAKLYFSLSNLRDDVYALSRDVKSSWRLFQLDEKHSHRLINLDITDAAAVRSVLSQIKPRTIFNLSAYGSYERQNNSQKIHQVNYQGVLNLILTLTELGCDAFVQAGSSSEYGWNCAAPTEDSMLQPNSDYSVSKGAASLLIKYYGAIKNLPVVNMRLYSIYGPWEERGRLVPRLIQKGFEKSYPPFADPHISRDFVYVDDCMHALVRAALTICKTDPGISINIASGKKTSLKDIAELSKVLFQIPDIPQFSSMPNRKWDLTNWYGNPTLALEKMKWQISTPIDAGLRYSASWEKAAAGVVPFGLAKD